MDLWQSWSNAPVLKTGEIVCGQAGWNAKARQDDEHVRVSVLITQSDVKKALAFRTFWIILHVVTCSMIIIGNGRTLNFW